MTEKKRLRKNNSENNSKLNISKVLKVRSSKYNAQDATTKNNLKPHINN